MKIKTFSTSACSIEYATESLDKLVNEFMYHHEEITVIDIKISAISHTESHSFAHKIICIATVIYEE